MHHQRRFPNLLFGTDLKPESAALAILVLLLCLIFAFLFLLLTEQPVQGQTYQVIHNFTGGLDGANPDAGRTVETARNLYGPTCGSSCP